MILIIALAAGAVLALNGPATGAPANPSDTGSAQYRVVGPKTVADRNAVARTGAAIDHTEHGDIYISATETEVAQIRKLGFSVELLPPPPATSD